MNRRSPLFRKLNCLSSCCRLNCFALRVSRSLNEACQALPSRKGCRDNHHHNHKNNCRRCS